MNSLNIYKKKESWGEREREREYSYIQLFLNNKSPCGISWDEIFLNR